MSRVRDETSWLFTHYSSTEDFLAVESQTGAHAISYKGQYLDLLIEDRKSPTTLVAFHSAVDPKIATYPVFSGRGIASDLGVNLVSISDPSIAYSGVNLAWHLGNSETGPLRPVLTPLIHHALTSISTERTILFGASGGGYAAAHFAPGFPDSVALVVNPRLTFRTGSGGQLSSYFELCHGMSSVGELSAELEEHLRPYGPASIGETTSGDMTHRLAIYQNLGDARFLKRQVLPFIEEVGDLPGVALRFNVDDFGHKPVPGKLLREIIHSLSEDTDFDTALNTSNFYKPVSALRSAVEEIPTVLRRADSQQAKYTALRRRSIIEAKRMQERNAGLVKKIESGKRELENTLSRNSHLLGALANARATIVRLNRENHRLRNPPSKLRKLINTPWMQKAGRIVPRRVKRSIRKSIVKSP